jgi:ATP-dependent DNA helicase RecG
MERRGSGLKKILTETKSLPGYTDEMKPKFYSDTLLMPGLDVSQQTG